MSKPSGRFLLVNAGVVALVLTIDTARSANWDAFAMALAIDGLILLLALQVAGRRVPVRLRHDLFDWAQSRAAATHQSVDRVMDRAVATFKERLEPVGRGEAEGDQS